VTTDVVGVIKSVIAAEEAACAQYKKIIKAVEGEDYVAQDFCVRLLADEEEHHKLKPAVTSLAIGNVGKP